MLSLSCLVSRGLVTPLSLWWILSRGRILSDALSLSFLVLWVERCLFLVLWVERCLRPISSFCSQEQKWTCSSRLSLPVSCVLTGVCDPYRPLSVEYSDEGRVVTHREGISTVQAGMSILQDSLKLTLSLSAGECSVHLDT